VKKVTDKLSWVCSGGQPYTESCVVCAGMASMAGTVLFLYASILGKRSSGLGFAMSIYLWKQ
jgi:hypothetical protein